jgi:hypothetical protein
MNVFNGCIVCIIAQIAFLTPIAYAGWSEDVRLTYREHEYLPQVIARNDTIHVAWQLSSFDQFISYMRSTDDGESWGSLINITQSNHRASYADLSLDENGLLATWMDDNDDNNDQTIAVATSLDGSVWNEPLYVFTDNMHHFNKPASTAKGDSIFLVYRSFRSDSTGLKPFRFLYSYDYGESWSEETTIGHVYSNVQDLLIGHCDGVLLVVWAGVVDSAHSGQYHVVGYRSTDAGQTWSDLIWISPDHWYTAQDPCMSCNEETGQLAVGYMDYRYQQYAFHGDVFIKISDDGGFTWPLEVMATVNHAAWVPSIDFVGDTLLAVWSDRQFYEEGQHEIFYNRSNNLGLTWEGEYRLTNAMGDGLAPWVAHDDGNVHVVWREDDREGEQHRDIYYKRYTPDPTATLDSETIQQEILSLEVYPNPFNSVLSLFIDSKGSGSLVIYDILGRIITEFEYESGSTLIRWDARDTLGNKVSSGIYFARAKTHNNFTAIKLLYMK